MKHSRHESNNYYYNALIIEVIRPASGVSPDQQSARHPLVPLAPVEGEPGPPPQPQAEGGSPRHHLAPKQPSAPHPYHRPLRDRQDIHTWQSFRDVAQSKKNLML